MAIAFETYRVCSKLRIAAGPLSVTSQPLPRSARVSNDPEAESLIRNPKGKREQSET